MAKADVMDFFENQDDDELEFDEEFQLDEETGEFGEFEIDDDEDSNDLNNEDSEDDEEETEEDEYGEESEEEDEEEEDVKAKPSTSKVVSRAEFKAMNQKVDSLIEAVNGLVGVLSKSNKPVEEEEDEEDFDFDDAKTFQKQLAKKIQKAVEQSITPLKQTNEQQRLQNEVAAIQAKYGAERADAMAIHVRRVLESNPSLSITKAFEMVATIQGSNGKATKKDSGNNTQNQKKKIKKPAAELVQKADKLKTSSSGIGDTDSRSQRGALTFEDALNLSFQQLKQADGGKKSRRS